jgi:hypothetical protein
MRRRLRSNRKVRAGRRFLISPVARGSRTNIARYNLSSNKWSIVCLAVSRGRASNQARTNSQKNDPSRFLASAAAPSPHARSRKWIQTRSNEASGTISGSIPLSTRARPLRGPRRRSILIQPPVPRKRQLCTNSVVTLALPPDSSPLSRRCRAVDIFEMSDNAGRKYGRRRGLRA